MKKTLMTSCIKLASTQGDDTLASTCPKHFIILTTALGLWFPVHISLWYLGPWLSPGWSLHRALGSPASAWGPVVPPPRGTSLAPSLIGRSASPSAGRSRRTVIGKRKRGRGRGRCRHGQSVTLLADWLPSDGPAGTEVCCCCWLGLVWFTWFQYLLRMSKLASSVA